MAQIKLNTTTSIVDFLKGQGKPSDFASRTKMFREAGLEDRLGKFVGSASQNVALLRQLQQPPAEIKPQTPAPLAVSTPPIVPEKRIDVSGLPPARATEVRVPTATDVLTNLGFQPTTFTAQDVVSKAMEAPLFKTFQERQDLQNKLLMEQAAAKTRQLETESRQKTQELIDTLGRRGLFFSGKTEMGIKDLTEALAASKEGVNRELAGKLLESDIDVRERVLKDVEQIVKDAQSADEKRQDRALRILEQQGLTIGPDGKTIVPTLAAEREARLVQTAEESAARENLRLQLSLEANARAQRSLELNEERLNISKAKLKLVGQFITGQAADQAYDEIVQNTRQTLNANRGIDGNIDPGYFKQFRDQVFRNMPAKLDDFDKEFVPQLSPEDREKLNVVAPGTGAIQERLKQSLDDIRRQFIIQEGLEEE